MKKISNPICCDSVGPIRDPMILPYNGRYYLVATSPDFWKGFCPGVKLWVSDDLINWEFVNLIVDANAIPQDKDYLERFWAPELFAYKGKFYCTFSAKNGIKDPPAYFRCYVAIADNIEGPYKIVEQPFVKDCTIDAHLFLDDDDKVYAFFNAPEGLVYMPFDPETGTLYGERVRTLVKGEEGEWDSIGIEGSFVVKRNGIYYHWYSSWTRGYEMGVATTDDLKKPFVKSPLNPIVSGYGTDSIFTTCGHNSCFRLYDGRDAIAFHATTKNTREQLCIHILEYPLTERMKPQEEVEL